MAHKHHSHAQTASTLQPVSRPPLLRGLSITALFLPLVLYIISLSFALKTIYSPDFAVTDLFNSTPAPSGLHQYASPFYGSNAATFGSGPFDSPTDFNVTYFRVPFLGRAGMDACHANFAKEFGNMQYCQNSVASASLYVAGAVLVGLALLLAAVYAGLAFASTSATTAPPSAFYSYYYSPAPQSSKEADAAESEGRRSDGGNGVPSAGAPAAGPDVNSTTTLPLLRPLISASATLLALLAAASLVLAQVLGVQSTVFSNIPTEGQAQDGFNSHWYMGTPALVFTSVAYLSAGLGAFVAATRCGVSGR